MKTLNYFPLVRHSIDTYCTLQDSLPIALPPPVIAPPLTVLEGSGDAMIFCNNNNARLLIPSGGGVQWWDPNGNPAPAQGSVLLIPNITRAQAGEYRCVLTSITKETASATTTIIVQCEYYRI